MPDRKLVLVDGMMVLYRAFFAIPSLSTRAGVPTNALYGFIRMAREIRHAHAPTHLAVVFDGGLPQTRLALLPQYKAQRPPMPAQLREQLGPAAEYLDLAGIPHLRVDGQEADDVMASVATWAVREGAEVLCATHDKDMYQVVSDRIRLVPVAGKGGAIGPAEVRSKTGVAPEQVCAWLALTGDTVDNIPGVPGVGPKTAAKLLGQYGGLPALHEAVQGLPAEKLRQALTEHWESVDRNLRLVTLDTRLPVVDRWERLNIGAGDPSRLCAFLEKYEFESMARELRQPTLFA